MPDIQSRDDIKALVDAFYGKVTRDALLAPIFSHVDWVHHLPIMYNFWSSILLGDFSYQGNPFQKHLNLPIEGAHFDQWLKLFTETVDEHFSGEVSSEAKNRAQTIASVFKNKLIVNR